MQGLQSIATVRADSRLSHSCDAPIILCRADNTIICLFLFSFTADNGVTETIPCPECGWYRGSISGERYPPDFCAASWQLATRRIRYLRNEFPNFSKEQISFNVHISGENDLGGELTRNYLAKYEIIQKLERDYTELDYDFVCYAVTSLRSTDELSPKFDVETQARRILTNLRNRMRDIKAWQEENEDSFCSDYDVPYGQCLVEIVQTLNGCFYCHAPNPTNTCSKCKFAKYCK